MAPTMMAAPEGHPPPHEAHSDQHHAGLADHVEAMRALFASLRAVAPLKVSCGWGENEGTRGARSEAQAEGGEARGGAGAVVARTIRFVTLSVFQLLRGWLKARM